MSRLSLLATLFLLLSGCASYKCERGALLDQPIVCPNKAAKSHWLYAFIPRHRSHIRWYDIGHWTTWMLFGNDDDGLFGETQTHPYKPDFQNGMKKAICWWVRNPLHNFTHYAIGSAHRINSELTFLNLNCRGICFCHYSPAAKQNYGCKCSSFLFALHGGKPFLSLRVRYTGNRMGEFYLGWRKEGNFGVKFHPFKSRSK